MTTLLPTTNRETWAQFVQEIEIALDAHRNQAVADREISQTFVASEGVPLPWSQARVLEWLSFQTYYEYQAILFISKWLQTTPETDVMVMLCQQIEDEANHFNWLNQHLEQMGGRLSEWSPLPEMVDWIETYYHNLPDTISRLAAHNLAGESGACRSFSNIVPFLPEDLQKTMRRIMPDEQFHLRIGRRTLSKYCVTNEQRSLARDRALEVIDLESRAIAAFNQKLASLES